MAKTSCGASVKRLPENNLKIWRALPLYGEEMGFNARDRGCEAGRRFIERVAEGASGRLTLARRLVRIPSGQ